MDKPCRPIKQPITNNNCSKTIMSNIPSPVSCGSGSLYRINVQDVCSKLNKGGKKAYGIHCLPRSSRYETEHNKSFYEPVSAISKMEDKPRATNSKIFFDPDESCLSPQTQPNASKTWLASQPNDIMSSETAPRPRVRFSPDLVKAPDPNAQQIAHESLWRHPSSKASSSALRRTDHKGCCTGKANDDIESHRSGVSIYHEDEQSKTCNMPRCEAPDQGWRLKWNIKKSEPEEQSGQDHEASPTRSASESPVNMDTNNDTSSKEADHKRLLSASASSSASNGTYLHHLDIGDTANTPQEMIQASPKLAEIERLQIHDFAFIRRSNGMWTYAIIANQDEYHILFVADTKGSIKKLLRKHWADFVRLVNKGNNNGSIENDRMEDTALPIKDTLPNKSVCSPSSILRGVPRVVEAVTMLPLPFGEPDRHNARTMLDESIRSYDSIGVLSLFD